MACSFLLGGSGQRKLNIIPIDSEGYSGRQLRVASNNGKIVLYLVPLQEELETAPLPFSSPEFSKMPKVACNNCLETIPLQMLALHSVNCQTTVSCVLVFQLQCIATSPILATPCQSG